MARHLADEYPLKVPPSLKAGRASTKASAVTEPPTRARGCKRSSRSRRRELAAAERHRDESAGVRRERRSAAQGVLQAAGRKGGWGCASRSLKSRIPVDGAGSSTHEGASGHGSISFPAVGWSVPASPTSTASVTRRRATFALKEDAEAWVGTDHSGAGVRVGEQTEEAPGASASWPGCKESGGRPPTVRRAPRRMRAAIVSDLGIGVERVAVNPAAT